MDLETIEELSFSRKKWRLGEKYKIFARRKWFDNLTCGTCRRKRFPFILNKSYPKINLTPSPQSKSENLIFRLEYKNTHPPIISVWLLRKQNFTYIISLSRKLFVNPRLWQNQNFYVSYLPIILNFWLILVISKDKFRNFCSPSQHLQNLSFYFFENPGRPGFFCVDHKKTRPARILGLGRALDWKSPGPENPGIKNCRPGVDLCSELDFLQF